MAELFDLIDRDSDSYLSFEELAAVFDLDNVQIKHFMNRLGVRAIMEHDAAGLTREVFVCHAVAALEECIPLVVDKEGASVLFLALVEYETRSNTNGLSLREHNHDDAIRDPLSTFVHSGVFSFLSESQIYEPTTRFRKDNRTALRVFSLGGNFKRPRELYAISRQEFCQNYGKFLREMVSNDDNPQHDKDKDTTTTDITLEGISVSVPIGIGAEETTVLEDVSCRFRPGTMTMIVGGEDGVYPELTLKENLIYSGLLRLGGQMKALDIIDLAESVLAKLGLLRVSEILVEELLLDDKPTTVHRTIVNIAMTLMAKPQVILLNLEETDAALPICAALKAVLDSENVTACVALTEATIDQVWHCCHSIMLLTGRGRVCFSGPSHFATKYIKQVGYSGASFKTSMAKALQDISNGKIVPQSKTQQRGNDEAALRLVSMRHLRESGAADIPSYLQEEAAKQWSVYQAQRLSKKTKRLYYLKPEPSKYGRHQSIKSTPFTLQLCCQLERALLVLWRNVFNMITELVLLCGVLFVVALISGVTTLSVDSDPSGIRLQYLVTEDPSFILREDNDNFFEQLFSYALLPNNEMTNYAQNLCLIVSPIATLFAANALLKRRHSVVWEAQHGLSTTAFLLAFSIVDTLQQTLQSLILALLPWWLRASTTRLSNYFVAFLLLSWLNNSWCLLFGSMLSPIYFQIILPEFLEFGGLIFGGLTSPFLFSDIYQNSGIALLCGFLSPTRFFVEAMAVSEHQCMPIQSGFTVDRGAAPNFPLEKSSFAIVGLAGNDLSVTDPNRRCHTGWYWYVAPDLVVGLAIRSLAFVAFHLYATRFMATMRWRLGDFVDTRKLLESVCKASIGPFMISALPLTAIASFLLLRHSDQEET
ncbi:ABC transporter [Seminavis robusta]|uniref:ABC transporter n=1 Tax=Seminavis robusta TaxID=568900 RepID=A0A9N8DPR7_9STRA|nr:ABC transporter [Seminavis robusta]|eukprot:Sro259_g101420.1 ABC transporter (877) ;mRNA; f:56551-59696